MREAFDLKAKKRLPEYRQVEAIARVLRTQSKYDPTHALALGKMYGIESAVIYLYELLHLYHEIISHYRDKDIQKKSLKHVNDLAVKIHHYGLQHYSFYK